VLSTQDAVTGQLVDRKFINDLPLVSRSVTDLVVLTPGVTEVDNTCNLCTANNFISNGSRNATADVLMDGVTTTNFEQNSGILYPLYTPWMRLRNSWCRNRISAPSTVSLARPW
jgi:hypothetical protein